MEITNKTWGTLTYKCYTIKNWKTSGVKHDDFDALFEQYINTEQCQHCAKIFTSLRDRCLDHDHATGLFRMVVCRKCNSCDSYIKYPDGFDKKECDRRYYQENKEDKKQYDKEYYENNIDKIKARIKARAEEIIICDCASSFRRDSLAKHRKSAKHISWRTNILRKYICLWKSQR